MLIRFCPRCGAALEDAERFGRLRRVCPRCHYVHFHDPKVAAVIFIEQEGKVLLIKRGVEPESGKWALPAGYVDYGEDPRVTAIREVAEETGLTIEVTRLLDVLFNGERNPVIVIVYAGRVIAGRVMPADDAVDADWFSPDALPELAFESTQLIIQRWQASQL